MTMGLQILLQSAARAALQSAYCTSSVASFMGSPVTGWIPFVTIAALGVLMALAMVYMLSPFLGRTDMKEWARFNIYEAAFSILLIILFASFATMLCTVDPVPMYNTIGLVPNECGSSNGVDNIYALAECDLYTFNQFYVGLNSGVFSTALGFALVPQITVDASNLGAVIGVPGIGFSDSFSMTAVVSQFLGDVIKVVNGLFPLLEVQLLILSSSIIIFSIFISIGLLSRIFGVTRTFGGAMIAFALGIGFVFPLTVSIVYGFLDQLFVLLQLNLNLNVLGVMDEILSCLFGTCTSPLSMLATLFSPYIEFVGIAAIGALLVPFMILTIVDTFIVSFSSSMGQKMDFLSLLSRIA